MLFEEFALSIKEICLHSLLVPSRPLLWTVIANPKAGGFTIRSRWKTHHALLQNCVKKAARNPLREGAPSKTALREGGEEGKNGLVFTKTKGHALEITRALLEEAKAAARDTKNKTKPFYIIITAGGDGTSLEVLTALFHAPPEIKKDFVILRLPMGTGNDGSDAREIDRALELLSAPAEIKKQKALRLCTASGKGPFLAFNILSVGLDAFVTHMTNKMKGKMPGDSYKLWVDIAALFYDRIYKVGFMEVRSLDDKGKEAMAFREKILLLAAGESGRRTYGSNKRILPDERNVCAIRQMPLLRKLAMKEMFSSGTHIDKPEAILWNARKIELSPEYPLLAQMDGEAVLLEKSDFPAVIEITEPVIPVLKPVQIPVNL